MILLVGFLRNVLGFSKAPIPKSPRVIGLLKASGIGDAIILSGVIADVRAHYPNAHLVLFSGNSNHAFARLIEGVDEVVALPIFRPDLAIRTVRSRRPDIMIDFGMWPRLEALIASLSGAKWVVGVRTPGQHRHFAFNKAIEHSIDHEICNYRNLVAPLGVVSKQMPMLRIGSSAKPPIDCPFAVLHLWPGGAHAWERSWPRERWFLLAETLSKRGLRIILTGGPNDTESTNSIEQAWRAKGIDVMGIAGSDPVETITWLRHSRGVVSVNTGLLHVAAAVDAPVIALNGPTSSRRWGPLGRHTRCVTSPMVPDGYLNLGLEDDRRFRTCMQAITVDSVVTAWDNLMAEVDASDESTRDCA